MNRRHLSSTALGRTRTRKGECAVQEDVGEREFRRHPRALDGAARRRGVTAEHGSDCPAVDAGQHRGSARIPPVRRIISRRGHRGCHGGMCDAFRWNIEYQFITGSQWVSHPGTPVVSPHLRPLGGKPRVRQEVFPSPDNAFETDYVVNFKKGAASPLIEGLEDFAIHSEQYYLQVDPAINVLATTQIKTVGPHTINGEVTMPVVYTKRGARAKCSIPRSATGKVFEIPQARS